ncbi:MAG: ABC transporter permease [Flavobacteriaceae bacterium]|nr:ABC transporter permease [Flavobacteriaceae bacterium]
MKNFLLDKDIWQEIYEVLRKNKVRTAITIIGVMWGIFLLITLLGVAKGFQNKFDSIFGDFATNSVFVWGQTTDTPFKGFQKGRPVRLLDSDPEMIEKAVKGVEFVVPRNRTQSRVIRNFLEGNFSISGDYPILDKVQKKKLIYGRFINDSDIKDRKKVAVISEDIYKQLFEKDEEPIGQYININSINYNVVGVFQTSNIGMGDDIHIPFSTFQQIYNQGNKIGWMMITGKPEFDINQIESDVKLQLKTKHKVHPDDNRAFGSFNLGVQFKKLNGFLTGMQFLTIFVGLATLIAGVFAIGNILLITVKERTGEIGIRRAIGATPREIKRQIILESVVLTTFAGILGIIAGGGVLWIINMLNQDEESALLNSTVSIPVILAALATLVILGTLIGMIPAQRAVSIKPIDALRDE